MKILLLKTDDLCDRSVQPEVSSVKGHTQADQTASWTIRESDTVHVRFRKWSSSEDPHLREVPFLRSHASEVEADVSERDIYLTLTTSMQTLADMRHTRNLVRRLKSRTRDAEKLLRGLRASGEDGTRQTTPIMFHLYESPGDRENYATLELIDVVTYRDSQQDSDDPHDSDYVHRFGEWLVFKVTAVESWQDAVRTDRTSKSYANLELTQTVPARSRQTSEICRCTDDIKRDLDGPSDIAKPHLIIPHDGCAMEIRMAPGARPRIACHDTKHTFSWLKRSCTRSQLMPGAANHILPGERTYESQWRMDVLTYLRWRSIRLRYASLMVATQRTHPFS